MRKEKLQGAGAGGAGYGAGGRGRGSMEGRGMQQGEGLVLKGQARKEEVGRVTGRPRALHTVHQTSEWAKARHVGVYLY